VERGLLAVAAEKREACGEGMGLNVDRVDFKNRLDLGLRLVHQCQTRIGAGQQHAGVDVFGLALDLTKSGEAEKTFLNELACGSVCINDIIAPTADPRLPFAGRGHSGFGPTRAASAHEASKTCAKDFCARHGIDRLGAADCLAIATPPGLFLGRCANFVNAELWGRPTDVPWAFVFPTDPLQVPRHPSQLYEATLEGLVLGAALLWLALRRGAFHRPGLIAGLFFAGYGTGRFVVEYFRQADPQFITPDNPIGFVIGSGAVGVTMGQLLSLPMVVLGLALIAHALGRSRRTA